MQHGKEGMHGGVGILPAQRRQNHKIDIPMLAQSGRGVMGAAVNSHGMASRGKSRPALLGEGLKSSIIRRDAPRSQNAYL